LARNYRHINIYRCSDFFLLSQLEPPGQLFSS
jgi:hypothetical protein